MVMIMLTMMMMMTNYNNVDMEVMATIAEYDDDEENDFFDKVDMCDLRQ